VQAINQELVFCDKKNGSCGFVIKSQQLVVLSDKISSTSFRSQTVGQFIFHQRFFTALYNFVVFVWASAFLTHNQKQKPKQTQPKT
jgi:hypothetical protein